MNRVSTSVAVVRSAAGGWRWGVVALAVAALTACGLSDEAQIRQWMADQRKTIHPVLQKVSEPIAFTPYSYDPHGRLDPFDPQKILMTMTQERFRGVASGLRPNLTRRREPLEAFALDQIRMVGMMREGQANVALLEANGTVHLVRVGNYIGQNFGRVTNISETEVDLRELYQDAAGEWEERPQKLELQMASAQGSE